MNKKALRLTLALCVFVLLQFSESAAQSGRQIKTEPTLETKEEKPVIDYAEEFRLATQNNPDCQNPENIKFLFPKLIDELVQEINKYATCGYRLQAVTSPPYRVGKSNRKTNIITHRVFAALLKYDGETQYEYQPLIVNYPGALFSEINEFARAGFVFRDKYNLTEIDDDPDESPDSLYFGAWIYRQIYFLERQRKPREFRKYTVFSGTMGWGKSPVAELNSNIKKALADGFYPLTFHFDGTSQFIYSILFEKIDEKPDQQISGKNNDNFTSKINSLSEDFECVFIKFYLGDIKSESTIRKRLEPHLQQGFRLLTADKFGAVVYKSKEASNSIDYRILNANKLSELSTRLASLSKEGAVFHSIISNEVENRLIFEIKPNSKERFDYKIINLTADKHKHTVKGAENPEIKVFWDEQSAKCQQLLKEGYVIHDLISSEGIAVLLERKL